MPSPSASIMDSYQALAILAFCAGAHAVALPQVGGGILPFGTRASTAVGAGPVTGSAAAGVVVNTPAAAIPTPALSPLGLSPPGGLPVAVPPAVVPSAGALPALSNPLGVAPAVPVFPPAAVPPAASVVPSVSVPSLSGLSVPVKPEIPAIPSGVPSLPTGDLTSAASTDALSKVVALGNTVFGILLDILKKGSSAYQVPTAVLPVPASLPNASLPLNKRQLGALTGALGGAGSTVGGLTSGGLPSTGSLTNAAGGLTSGGLPSTGSLTNAAGGLTSGGLPSTGSLTNTAGGLTGGLTSGSSPVSGVAGTVGSAAGSVPAGGLTGAASGLTSGTSPVSGVAGTVANTVGSVPVAGGAAGTVANTVGGVTSGSSPLAPVTGAVGTVANAAGSVPVVGSTVGSAVSGASSSTPNINAYPLNGIPGTDPVGAFSISVIATLLSLLKKDPLSLFGPSLPVAALVKRDLPELHARGIPEIEKRQLQSLPSLSQNLPGGGIGSLPLSGIPGVSPDLAFLVGSIAKNLAVPGGVGLGSITQNILSILNGVVPNFLFQLPVVQDSVPTFGVLQLLSSINPAKFKDLGTLTSLASLQQAASTLPQGDLAFLKTLPAPADLTNLVQTIITLADNILSLPGNVANLRASVAVLALKNLGLSVPGLS